MHIWDIVDQIYPGFEITEIHKRLSRAKRLMSTAAGTAVFVAAVGAFVCSSGTFSPQIVSEFDVCARPCPIQNDLMLVPAATTVSSPVVSGDTLDLRSTSTERPVSVRSAFWRETSDAGDKIISVALKPTSISNIADHFRKVTRPIEWPVDEPDVD